MRLPELPVLVVTALPIRRMLGRSPGRYRPIRQGPPGRTTKDVVEQLEQTGGAGILVPRGR